MTVFSDLVTGYARFREHGWAIAHERWATLAERQAPKAMVIACSDSKTDPATVF